jgi:hypothetical protein
MKGKVLVIVFFLISNICIAGRPTIHDTVAINSSTSNELVAYKLLAETAERSYENQKETTHWFLGIIGTFLISVIVSQVILNTRFNTRLIKDLQSNLDKTVAEQKLAHNQDLQQTVDNVRSEMNLSIENQLKRVYSSIDTATSTFNLQLELFKNEQKKVALKTSSTIKINEGKLLMSDSKYSLAITKFISAGEDLIGAEEDVYPALDYIDSCVDEIQEMSTSKHKSVKNFLLLAEENSQDDISNIETIKSIDNNLQSKKVFKLTKGVKVYL